MKTNYYNKIILELKELHNKYPSFELSKHISGFSSEYGDVWGISDKELYFSIKKYKERLELDFETSRDESQLTKILSEGMDLDSILDEEEED